MATLNRRPLTNRHAHQLPTIAPSTKPQRTVSGNKRPRSPEPLADSSVISQSSKRVKAIDPPPLARDKARERKYMEREQQKAEFKEKYTRAFPSFTFYFDELNITPEEQDFFEESIEKLGGKIVKFLDKTVTHFISNRTETTQLADKENTHKSGVMLKSPIKLKNRLGKDIENGNPALLPATLEHKVWNTTKLESVVQRLIDPLTATSSGPFSTSKKQTLSLERLLKYEQRNGTTERDPTQKRHDFKYFTRGSRFVLVEDIREELATIAVHEYPQPKPRDGVVQTPWPVLHCHPQSRGPFIAFDDKEKRRWEKLQKAEREQKAEGKKYTNKVQQAEMMKRKAEASLHAKRAGDLRRSVSMNNLHRRATFPHHALNDEFWVDVDGDGENLDSAVASGFLFSVPGTAGYMAASGNSVGITSTTGTTSTAGYTSRSQLPSALNGRLKHIVTSRKFSSAAADKENKAPSMGPPSIIPERQPLLRKSRSTNTLKLPKREEGSKPGYCESCRTKFDDFKEHTTTRKHQRFATNAANFLQLDCVLARVQRRTKVEIANIRMQREATRQRRFDCNSARAQVLLDHPKSSISVDCFHNCDILAPSGIGSHASPKH
ncbi:hypothetical protein C0995_015980 [Termitomyces sp. Mi166|nr:hypothetical protein C0995_015980 [Termitomyces sp. Mi166\